MTEETRIHHGPFPPGHGTPIADFFRIPPEALVPLGPNDKLEYVRDDKLPGGILHFKSKGQPDFMFIPPTGLKYDYDVKSWPAFFSAMITGKKKHDMRDKRDRDYKVGDRVLLREYEPFGGGYTGHWALVEITYITSNDTPCAMSSVGLGRDMAILSVELLGQGK